MLQNGLEVIVDFTLNLGGDRLKMPTRTRRINQQDCFAATQRTAPLDLLVAKREAELLLCIG
jgi:GH24 family phage-related lysozyme (muramidase)